jgi:hypothetical protein
MRRPTRAPEAAGLAAGLALLAALAGCAKKGPPTGGPPDLEPPRVVSTSPDSGAAGVPTHARVAVTFSEGMEPRSTGAALEFAPPLLVQQQRWSGNTVTLVLKDTLRADHTYTLYVGAGARDRHGNPLVESRAVVFTTAPTFPPGAIAGHVDAVGFKAGQTSLWLYRGSRLPDSTARDFDALGVADSKGDFRVSGLGAGPWRVWGFADLNHNRSFEPASDLLVMADTVLTITAEHPEVSGLVLHMLNPKAPGRFAGSVLDTVSDHSGVARLIVTSLADTTRRVSYEIPESGGFDLQWEKGTYRVRAYRDLDRNKAWKRDTEPASDEIEVTIEPGGELTGVTFVLKRPGAEGTP